MRIGLISDTHGLVRPEALDFLRGYDHIIHGGDVHKPGVLEELALVAPVSAVRGNNDEGPWSTALAESEVLTLGDKRIYVIHDLSLIDIDPHAAKIDVVVHGHSHKPGIEQRGEVIYINPGSAGPRRFKLPISVGELVIEGGKIRPSVSTLIVSPSRRR
jgi:putative phosphoesterase